MRRHITYKSLILSLLFALGCSESQNSNRAPSSGGVDMGSPEFLPGGSITGFPNPGMDPLGIIKIDAGTPPIDNPITRPSVNLRSAVCGSKPTDEFKFNQLVLSVSSSNNQIVFNGRIDGISTGMKIDNLIGILNNSNPHIDTFTVSDWNPGVSSTVVTVRESGLDWDASALTHKANIHYEIEDFHASCDTSGVRPLFVYGSNFPTSQEKVSLIVKAGNNGGPECTLFALGGHNYSWVDSGQAMWTIPGYLNPSSQTFPNTVVMDKQTFNTNSSGQVSPATGGCNLTDISEKRAWISFGSNETKFSNYFSAFTYGSQQTEPVSPKIKYVCVTDADSFYKGYMNGLCIDSAAPGRNVVKVKAGDILTIIGENFQKQNRPPIDGSIPGKPDPFAVRKRVPMEMTVALGGYRTGQSVLNTFALPDGYGTFDATRKLVSFRQTFPDPMSGLCSSYDPDTGDYRGMCQRIHAVVPRILNLKPPFNVNLIVVNTDQKRFAYGGSKTVCHRAKEQSIKYYGDCSKEDDSSSEDHGDDIVSPPSDLSTTNPDSADLGVTAQQSLLNPLSNSDDGDDDDDSSSEDKCVVPPAEVPNPPPEAVQVTAVATATDTIKCSFQEVGDDPSGYPLADVPVVSYDFRSKTGTDINTTRILTDTDFNISSSKQISPQGKDGSGVWRSHEVIFNGLAPSTYVCCTAKAMDGIGQLSPLVPTDAGSSRCAVTAAPPTNPAPCPPLLQGELDNTDPQHQGRVFWSEPTGDGSYVGGTCEQLNSDTLSRVVLKFKGAPFVAPLGGTEFDDPTATVLNIGSVLAPGLEHSHKKTGLAPGHVYYFVAKSYDSRSLPSLQSNILPLVMAVAPPTGNMNFVDLSRNLPTDPLNYTSYMQYNTGNSMQILRNAGTGSPWILSADTETGPTIFKVADGSNVSSLDGTADDGQLLVPISMARTCADANGIDYHYCKVDEAQSHDNVSDLIDRDRHFLRDGAGRDCDGNGVDPKVGGIGNSAAIDTFAVCNMPKVAKYNYSADIQVGKINGDAFDDIIIANANPGGDPAHGDFSIRADAIYINSGHDICDVTSPGNDWIGTGRTLDVADGIPCFQAPVELPMQQPDYKATSSRIRLYTALADKEGPADLIAVMTDEDRVGLTFYSNGCKLKTAACTNSDFNIQTGTLFGINTATGLPTVDLTNAGVFCRDIAFIDLNEDGLRDMVCTRANDSGATGMGNSLSFLAQVDPVTQKITFRENPGLVPASLTSSDCNSSFVVAKSIPNEQFLLVGHKNVDGAISGNASCPTQLFRKVFGAWQAPVTLADDSVTCHNGVLEDVGYRFHAGDPGQLSGRRDSAVDVGMACGTPQDIASHLNYRGARLFLNDGNDSFIDFEAAERHIFIATDGADTSSGIPFEFSADSDNPDTYRPGALNALTFGDLDADGIPDLFFGASSLTTGGRNQDYFFKHLSQVGSPKMSPVSKPAYKGPTPPPPPPYHPPIDRIPDGGMEP